MRRYVFQMLILVLAVSPVCGQVVDHVNEFVDVLASKGLQDVRVGPYIEYGSLQITYNGTDYGQLNQQFAIVIDTISAFRREGKLDEIDTLAIVVYWSDSGVLIRTTWAYMNSSLIDEYVRGNISLDDLRGNWTDPEDLDQVEQFANTLAYRGLQDVNAWVINEWDSKDVSYSPAIRRLQIRCNSTTDKDSDGEYDQEFATITEALWEFRRAGKLSDMDEFGLFINFPDANFGGLEINSSEIEDAYWYSKGYALYALGKYDEAILVYDEAIRLDPEDANAWVLKGLVFVDQGKYDEAIQCYDEAIQLDPENTEAWENKGDVLVVMEEYDKAIEAYDEAIKLDPEDAGIWNNKGKVLSTLGKYNEAIQAYDEVIRLDPDFAGAWINKGNAFYQQDKYDKAIQAYDEAVRLDPGSALARRNKGLALYNLGKNDEAVLALDEAIKLDPQDTSARDLKSAILVESAEPWQASNGAWVTDAVTDTTWLDGWTPYQGQGFTVAIAIHSEDYTRDMFVVADGTLTLDGYVNKRKVWTEEFEVSRYDFGTYEIPLFGTRGVAYQSPRIPFSDLGVSKDTCVDIWMTFETSGYTLEDESTVCT